jgi:SAP domain
MATLWEKAKEKLIQEIKDGVIKDDMKAADIHARDPVYKAVKIDNFKNNLRELRKRMKKFRQWADFDDEALRKDRELYPVDYEGRWGGSKAEELLREDMKLGVHKQIKPSEFWLKRDEYKCYDKDQFRKHIYQEERRGKETMFWLVVKDEKKKEKDDKKARQEAKRLMIEADPLQGLTVAQLKDKLRGYKLQVGGTKQALIQRIKDHEAGISS